MYIANYVKIASGEMRNKIFKVHQAFKSKWTSTIGGQALPFLSAIAAKRYLVKEAAIEENSALYT